MKGFKRVKIDGSLLAIAVVSLFLNGYNIWDDKYANTYYTTAVASMLQSFSNFFYGSLDPAGSVTVDKPPLAFWIQTAVAYVFGLHGWSVILPQALAGVGSVLLIYFILKPAFGVTAARIGSLVMALTPVLAAVSRTNNIDSMLVFTLLVGTRMLFKGIRDKRTGLVLGAFAMIGVAFNMKMLQAYMVLPAFYLFYVLAAKANWKRKTAVLAGATALMLVISVSWAVIVDSIPADKRPYIGSSESNSVLELAFGYNGVSRLTGNQGPGGGGGGGMQDGRGSRDGGFTDGAAPNGAGNAADGAAANGNGSAAGNGANGGAAMSGGSGTDGSAEGFPGQDGGYRQGGFQGGGGNGGGMFGTGAKGPLRLFQSGLSGQASWLLPFAFFACLAIFASFRWKSFTRKHKEALFWLAWLVPGMMFFSAAGFFHQYYLIMLAAPVAALAGAGWVELWDAYRNRGGWVSYLLPVSVTATAALQWYIMQRYDDTIGKGWSVGVAAAGILMTMVLFTLKGNREMNYSRIIGTVSVLVMLIGPAYWALTPITYGQSSMLPQAGPGGSAGTGGFGGGGGVPGGGSVPAFANGGGMPTGGNGGMNGSTVNEQTLNYLREHNSGEEYLFATFDYSTAAPYIIDEGEKVVTMGGFSGSDPVYSVEKLQKLVESGKLKYFMISGGGGGGRGGSSELTTWIAEHGTVVPTSEWQSDSVSSVNGQTGGFRGMSGGSTLYEVYLDNH